MLPRLCLCVYELRCGGKPSGNLEGDTIISLSFGVEISALVCPQRGYDHSLWIGHKLLLQTSAER